MPVVRGPYPGRVGASGPDEADTCRDLAVPALLAAGWSEDQIHEQFPVLAELPAAADAGAADRKRRADYVLELVPGLALVVVEAKRLWASAADGIQQAVRYGTRLGVPLALSTNGTGWVLYNATTGLQGAVDNVPTPVEAWKLLVEQDGLTEQAQALLRAPFNREKHNADGTVKELRYYQRRAARRDC